MKAHLPPHETTATSTHLNHPIRVSFVPLDLDLPLEEQHGGKFDAILHKMTEDILLLSKISSSTSSGDSPLSIDTSISSGGDKDENQLGAIERVERLNKYQRDHPGCCLVDHPRNIQAVMSRSDIAHILSSSLQNICTESGIPVRAPRFLVHDGVGTMVSPGNHSVLAGRVQEAPFSYPLIAKPLAAAGTSESHKMVIVLRPSGLDCILPMPSLLQEYANHDGVLYKVYVLGDTVRVFARPSLPNLPEGDVLLDFVEFDSQRPYPTLTDFFKVHPMTNTPTTTSETATDQNKRKMDTMVGEERFERKREKIGKVSWTDNKASTAPTNAKEAKVTAEDIRPVVSVLRNAFGLELFGFDVILSGNEMLVVDVNYFPSYKEVSNFSSLLAQYLTQRAIEGRMQSFSSS
jgi:inositol-1,3,4-trisphosphate 5/6-kinase/inositol-tetrakisphosphate 1-kinase